MAFAGPALPPESGCLRFGAVPPDGRHHIPLVRQYFLIASENLVDADDGSAPNSGIARGALAGCIMEHRGVRYELRRALGNDEWVWTVYTPAPKQGYVSGDRYFAMQRAISVIDRWCGRNAEGVPSQATLGGKHGAARTPVGTRIDPPPRSPRAGRALLQLLRHAQMLPEMRQRPERPAFQFGIVAALGVGVESATASWCALSWIWS